LGGVVGTGDDDNHEEAESDVSEVGGRRTCSELEYGERWDTEVSKLENKIKDATISENTVKRNAG
jgi:hypothetical protein